MTAAIEAENRKKAALYTAVIVTLLLLLCIFITFPKPEIKPPVVADLIEINLGNYDEGDGQEQPLIKGEMGPADDVPTPPAPVASANDPANNIEADDNSDDKEAAPVVKPEKTITKPTEAPRETVTKAVKTNNPPTTVPTPTPKPPKPKYTYPGAGKGTGNGADQDNWNTSQGNKPGGRGDAGDPNGKPDSYGNTPGGRSGGPRVIGNRKIIKYYAFTGDLDKATIYAQVKVSAAGKGTFVGFGKGSTQRGQEYINAINNYLRTVEFDKSGDESLVTVVFNFNVN